MVINSNLSAMYASRQEGLNAYSLQKSMEKLSSGSSINRASDDAANLAVSEKMRAQIRGLNQASKNVGDLISFTTTAEGYLDEVTGIVQRLRELAVQSGNGIYSDEDRMQIQVEVSQLVAEIDRVASTASFNGMKLFSGKFSKESENPIYFQLGANCDERISMNIEEMTANSLGLKGAQGSDEIISLKSADESNIALATLDEALKNINKQRADLGAITNRGEIAQKAINIASENLSASVSRISDTDMARELVSFTKDQLLHNAAMSMIAQANSQAQSVISLLR